MRELVGARQLDPGVALPADREQRLETRLLQSICDRRPAAMIDHEAHVRLFDQRQQRKQLIVLDLDLQKQSEIDQLFQKAAVLR